ncbi:MAG TPA: hypothetical protein VGG06_25545 [Thermoanaerobaculia bacterium]
MRRGILAAALVLLAAPAAAQQRHLGAPVYDTEAETTHRQISWDDFKSRATGRGLSRWGEWVLLATRLRLGGYEIGTRREDGGEWVATATGLRPYAMMEKLLSGASSGGRTKSSLAHQQRLFDLAEAQARRLAAELVGATGRGELPYDAEQDLRYQIDTAFDRAQRELTDLQQRYTDETRGGEDRAEERRWAEEIARMFDEATAALAAALGEGGDP